MTELNSIAHQADPSRKTVIRRCEFASDIPDVYSPSIWAGWYRGKYTEYKSSTEKEVKKVNYFLHAEWGGDSEARRHSEDPDKGLANISTGTGTDERGLDYLLTGGQARASKDGDWSESYICNLFDWHLKEQETMPWLTGAAQWAFKDFSTPLRPEDPVPRMNQKGLVERDHTPKEAYYVFQSYWTEKPMARIYGHTWPIRWGAKDEKKLIKVYSNCPGAELFLNGASCGVKQRNSQNFPAAGLRWEVEFREGDNHARVVARKGGVEVTDEIRFRYQTAKWGKPGKLVLAEVGRAGDSVTVEARMLDANDVQCLNSRDFVRFGLAGEGRLIDNLGTSTGSRYVGMYNGRALISLERTKGELVVSVVSKGLPAVFLKVA
jgi:beta-galactosidase